MILLLSVATLLTGTALSQQISKHEVVYIISGSDEFGGNVIRIFSRKIVEVVEHISRVFSSNNAHRRRQMVRRELSEPSSATFAIAFGYTSGDEAGKFTTVAVLSPKHDPAVTNLTEFLAKVESANLGRAAGIEGSLEYCVTNVFTDAKSTVVAKWAVFLIHMSTSLYEVDNLLNSKHTQTILLVFIVFPYPRETCTQAEWLTSRLKQRAKISLVYCGNDFTERDISADFQGLIAGYYREQEKYHKGKATATSYEAGSGGWPDKPKKKTTDDDGSFQLEFCPQLHCQWWFLFVIIVIIGVAFCSVLFVLINALEIKRLHARQRRLRPALVYLPCGGFFLASLTINNMGPRPLTEMLADAERRRSGRPSLATLSSKVSGCFCNEKPAMAALVGAALMMNPALAAERRQGLGQPVRHLRQPARAKRPAKKPLSRRRTTSALQLAQADVGCRTSAKHSLPADKQPPAGMRKISSGQPPSKPSRPRTLQQGEKTKRKISRTGGRQTDIGLVQSRSAASNASGLRSTRSVVG